MIIFMPLTNPCSPRAVHEMPYCPLSGLILRDIPRHLTFELGHVRKCTCRMIFSQFYSFFCVHVQANLAMICNKCIDCGFEQYRTQYTSSRLRLSVVYRTVLPSPQSITHKYSSGYIRSRQKASFVVTQSFTYTVSNLQTRLSDDC